jgi:hypothetical protein
VKKQPGKETNPGDVSRATQLAAACTVHNYEASRLLDVRQPGRLNEVPDREFVKNIFKFSRTDLFEYIRANPGLADALHGRSLDQRGTPSAFMEDAPGGYKVGWFDGSEKELRFHERIEEAAADFVLGFWGMPRTMK